MRPRSISGALCGSALALAMTACGTSTPESADPADEPVSSTGGPPEQITPGGIAVVVIDHLGSDAVRKVSAFEAEPGSVSVMIALRDRTPHNFAVQVYSPEQSEGELGATLRCPPERRLGRDTRCQALDNGTVVTSTLTPYGFSDDNVDGVVVSGTSSTRDNGAGMAMYESYDDSPAVSPAEMEAILGDPRLAWRTDPAVNEAGADVAVEQRAG